MEVIALQNGADVVFSNQLVKVILVSLPLL
jgi:hypothetical protein